MPETPVSRITLAAEPSAAGSARAFVTLVLRHWRRDALLDEAVLVVSELVTNAVQAMRSSRPATPTGDPFGAACLSVQLAVGSYGVRLSVRDSSPRVPRPRTADDEAEHGRGLLIVQAVSARWGTHHLPSGDKVVWAELPGVTAASTASRAELSPLGLTG